MDNEERFARFNLLKEFQELYNSGGVGCANAQKIMRKKYNSGGIEREYLEKCFDYMAKNFGGSNRKFVLEYRDIREIFVNVDTE